MSAVRAGVQALLVVLAGLALAGCRSGPRPEVLVYGGGFVAGDAVTDGDRYTIVGLTEMEGPMAERTTIRLADGVPVAMHQVDASFLLGRGRVFMERRDAEGQLRFEQVDGLSHFDPDAVYFVIVGPRPHGPFYRFDVRGGRAVAFGTEWVAELSDDRRTLRPGPVFIDASGRAREMPLTRADAEALWGPPVRVVR